MPQAQERRGRRAFWLTVSAFAWSAALVGAAFVLPIYGSSSALSTGTNSSASLTLVQVNGLGVLIPMGFPLVIVALVWAALHRKCSHGGRVPGYAAWTLVAVASVGLFIAPVAALLWWAAAITPSGKPRAGGLTEVTA